MLTTYVSAHIALMELGDWTRRMARDRRGLTVSAVILIGILVVAVAAFGLIAAGQIKKAGEEVKKVKFQ